MFGVVTRNAEELEWNGFERGFYEVKDVSGRVREPTATGTNMLSCFGDNAAVADEPALGAVSADGELATRDRPYFDWSYVCPTRPGYRDGLLELVEDCAAVARDVRLDDVGFPRAEYCYCDHCEAAFADSPHEDRKTWRTGVITDFVAEAADRVPGRLSLTLYPDPYPGHLIDRSGVDVDALAAYVDEYVVTLYDTFYGTTYWLEVIASAFRDRLPVPFSVELYAVDVEVDRLIHAAEVVDAYAEDVFFGYDAATARAAIRRLRAEGRDGVSHGG